MLCSIYVVHSSFMLYIRLYLYLSKSDLILQGDLRITCVYSVYSVDGSIHFEMRLPSCIIVFSFRGPITNDDQPSVQLHLTPIVSIYPDPTIPACLYSILKSMCS